MIEINLSRFSVTFGIISIVLLLASIIRSRFKYGIRNIPGPTLAAYSRLWNVFVASSGSAPEIFQDLHQNYGNVVRVGPNHVAISDPAYLPIIYGTNNRFLKTGFYKPFSMEFRGQVMHSMFSTSNPVEHKTLKQAVSNKYSLSALQHFEPQVDACTNLFIRTMEEYAMDQKVVDLGEWLQWYAFDAICAITFNRRFGFMDERKDIQDVIAGIENGLHYGSIVGQTPELHPWLLGNQALMKFLSFSDTVRKANPIPIVTRMVEDAIKEYDSGQSQSPARHDFLAWFRKEGQKSPERMTQNDLMNHLMNNLLAGSDTTAISLRAIFYYLIKNPACYAKLLREILSTENDLPSENIPFAKCVKMPYLQACIKEAMRLHPGVGFPLERYVPQEGLDIGDFHIPAGTIVGMNAWVVHRDKTIYGEDAGSFLPDRWIDAEPEQLKLMEKYFFSFGAGTRTCIGKNISIMEMGKMIPQVLRKFDISWASAESEWTIKTFWFAKQTGFQVRFHLRAETA